MREEVFGVIVGAVFAFFGVRLVGLARAVASDARALEPDEPDAFIPDLPGPHPFHLWLVGCFFTVGGTAVLAFSLYRLIVRGGP